MLYHHRLVEALLGDFEKENASPVMVDEFKSALIVAYEHALESGITPAFALGATLDWISAEFKRYAGLPYTDA